MQKLTDLSVLRGLCQKYGFSLSKKYGQNFIVNAGVCPKICEAAEIGPESNVLEIGPGFGTLTTELANRAQKVVALEVDERLRPVLAETLAGDTDTEIVFGDVLDCDLKELISQKFNANHITICANLPYYITSPIIMKVLESRLPLKSMTVMVQKEAAERIAAVPGTRSAGAISYAVRYYSVPEVRFTVKPGSFYPPPKVTSAVITLRPVAHLPLEKAPEREARLFLLVRAAFSQRRKTFANAASAGLSLPKERVAQALDEIHLPPLARPEQLTLEDYVALEKALWPTGA